MDRVRIFITATALLFASAAIADAQEYVAPPVEVSSQKVKKDGKIYYSHVVKERQTLYSISKAYNVTQDEIIEANPGLMENGLKKNSIIMIPAQSEARSNGEALQNQENEAAQDSVQTSGVRIHIVKWYETLQDIALKYNVSEYAIIAANNLKDGKIKSRQKLLIPTEEYVDDTIIETPEEEDTDEEDMELETAFDDKPQEETTPPYVPKSHIQATMLMPFKATGTSASKSSMDFYSGVLIAARELGQSGIDIDLNVYDISDGSYGATQDELESSDIIIGPISEEDIKSIYSVAPEIKALISPLDPKAEYLTDSLGTMVHAPASRMAQYEDLTQWIKEDLVPGDTVIVIFEKGVRNGDCPFQEAIDSAHMAYIPLEYSILEGRRILGILEGMMTTSGTNRVLIVSESEAFVNDAVRNLNLASHHKRKVVLYAPAKMRTYETIDVEHFHHLNMHTSLTYHIDYSNDEVKCFSKKYWTFFNTEPSQFAFQGYDLAKYFLGLCAKYGDAWMQYVEDIQMLQCIFNLRPTESGGYINTGTRRVVYEKGYTVKVIR